MKSINLLSIAFTLIFASNSIAQESAAKYDQETNCMLRYYYYPNLEAYFDVQTSIYYYKDKGEWVTNKEIPAGYKGYSLYKMTNVAIRDYDEQNVLQFLPQHKKKFPYNSKPPRAQRTTASAD